MLSTDHVTEFLGVRDCSLAGSRMVVSKGRRLQIFLLSYCGPVPATCPVCGSPLHNHGSRSMAIASTPHLGAPTELEIEFPRLRCQACRNIWRPKIEGVDEVHRMTEAACAEIAQSSLSLTFREIAEEYPLSHATVKNVFEDYVHENIERLRFKVPAFMGISEKNLERVGTITVITDLENRTVFDMVQGSSQSELENYFSQLEGLDQVQLVSSDLCRTFWRSITKYTQNATWVIDRFHVVHGAIEALDSVLKSLQGELEQKGRPELKRELAHSLAKRACDLNLYDASVFREIMGCSAYAVIMTAYDLKEDFFNIYDEHQNSRDEAEAAFETWRESIPSGKAFDSFRILAGTVENHRELIFNYWDCPAGISIGYTEYAKRLINESGMKGRGCSFETLRARTLYRKQNLERIIARSGLSIGPRIDAPGPLFLTEPDQDGEIVHNFIDGK